MFFRVTEDSFPGISKTNQEVSDSFFSIASRSNQVPQPRGAWLSAVEHASVSERNATECLTSTLETGERSSVDRNSTFQLAIDDLHDGKEGLENGALIYDDFLPFDAGSAGHDQKDNGTPHPRCGLSPSPNQNNASREGK